ncbi:latrophilin-like protein LAT-2 [Neocloeon triangulifer]|uniref:latrophilin-like protein LAT-2 n=1 Tax=Neocloeon triangulifer TaxID=2078957 RepID=UPI00286F7E25|nr:latrophilin-like protein LAT-2 [Neocloeon triangulifer]
MDTLYAARVHGFAAPGLVNLTGLEGHEGLLSLLAVLGSSVSLVALVFAFITYSLFSDLRTISGTALINLLAALFMVQLLFVIGVGGVQDHDLCWSLALALHYMRLSVFCWLAAMTFDLYCCFRENVSLVAALPSPPALRQSFARLSLFAWGAPLLPTLAAGLLQMRPAAAGLSDPNCWFLDDVPAAATFAVPAAALLIADLAFLVRAAAVARAAVGLQLEQRVKAKMLRRRRLQLWLFFRLAAFLAVVSAVGVFGRLMHSQLLLAVFSVAAGLQGLVVALSVACSCRVLKLYTRPRRPPPAARPGALHKAPSAMHLLQCDASPV